MMIIDTKHAIGDIVYLKTDIDQYARMVTGMVVRAHGIIYELSLADRTSNHFDFELSIEENAIMNLS